MATGAVACVSVAQPQSALSSIDTKAQAIFRAANTVQKAVEDLKDLVFVRVAWGRCNWDVVQLWMHEQLRLYTALTDPEVKRGHFAKVFGANVKLEVRRKNRWLRGILIVPSVHIEDAWKRAKHTGPMTHALNGFTSMRIPLEAFLCDGDAERAHKHVDLCCDVRDDGKGHQGVFAKIKMGKVFNFPVSTAFASRAGSQ